ncbi:MAG: DUF6504 family protein [bacterium]
MRMEDLSEKVVVGAVFGSGNQVRPAWFIWNGRKYTVKETTYTWTERRGTGMLYHFAVTDGADLFELVLDNASLAWTLEKVEYRA